jgi:hypothetical protein
MTPPGDVLADLRKQFAENELPVRLRKTVEHFVVWRDTGAPDALKSLRHEAHQLSGACAPLGFESIGEHMQQINILLHNQSGPSPEVTDAIHQALIECFAEIGLQFPEAEPKA